MENIINESRNSSLLYKSRRNFRYFEGITKESSKKIDYATKVFYDKLRSLNSFHGEQGKTPLFVSAVNYLLHNFYLTYDEKIIFLIRLVDPTLRLLAFYDDLVKDNQEAINSGPIIKGNILFTLNKENEEKLAAYSESKIGCYEPLLIKYEDIYKKKLLQEESLDKTTNLQVNYTKYVTKAVNLDSISLEINPDELDDIINDANEYLKRYPNPNLNDLLFQLLHESGNLNYETVKTKLIFIIFVLDKNFIYKDVYDNNYNLVTIRNIISNMFGCYYEFLMQLERKYVKDNEEPCSGAQLKMPSYH